MNCSVLIHAKSINLSKVHEESQASKWCIMFSLWNKHRHAGRYERYWIFVKTDIQTSKRSILWVGFRKTAERQISEGRFRKVSCLSFIKTHNQSLVPNYRDRGTYSHSGDNGLPSMFEAKRKQLKEIFDTDSGPSLREGATFVGVSHTATRHYSPKKLMMLPYHF